MQLNTMTNTENRQSRKRVGRGDGSQGKTCGRGMNGYGSRTGSHHKYYFEGGQMPLNRRLPKRGFNNYNRKDYTIINIETINDNFETSEEPITQEVLLSKGLISAKKSDGLKILGQGDITVAVIIVADKFTASAKTKVEACGGKCVLTSKEG